MNSRAVVSGTCYSLTTCNNLYAEQIQDPSAPTEEIQPTQIIIAQLRNEEFLHILPLPPPKPSGIEKCF